MSVSIGGEVHVAPSMQDCFVSIERISLTYPSGHQVTYAYTARGQLQSVTDWLSNQTGYSYDNADRLTAITSPNGVAGQPGLRQRRPPDECGVSARHDQSGEHRLHPRRGGQPHGDDGQPPAARAMATTPWTG